MYPNEKSLFMSIPYPRPFFDTLEQTCAFYKQCQIESQENVIRHWLNVCLDGTKIILPDYAIAEYGYALRFLYEYRGSEATFKAYRLEIDRFMQWSWLIQQKSLLALKRLDIEDFIEFCQKPPKRWINLKTVSRFRTKEGSRVPNSEWRPFTVTISKKAFQEGERPEKVSFELSQQGIKQIFAILSSFYNALIQEEVTEINPILQIRQKSKFIQKQANTPIIRRLSDQQWKAVLDAATELAQENPVLSHVF